jgi:hypothetical protein
MIGRPASTTNSPTPFGGQRPRDSERQIERQELAHDPLRDPVVANDICHVYFVNDAEMHALHNLLARMIEEQAFAQTDESSKLLAKPAIRRRLTITTGLPKAVQARQIAADPRREKP